jgi:phage gpG-like protein
MIEQEIDVSVMRGRLRALRDLSFVTGALDSIAHDMTARAQLGFRDQQDPWGIAWTPLRPSTIKARRKGKGGGSEKILRNTGVLAPSVQANRTGPLTIEMGSNVPYAAPNQFGATINHGARAVLLRMRVVKNANGVMVNRFASKKHKKVTEKLGTVQAYTVKIPARPFLPMRSPVLVDLPASWTTAIQARLVAAVNRSPKGGA